MAADKPFRFLDLPQELQDAILDKVEAPIQFVLRENVVAPSRVSSHNINVFIDHSRCPSLARVSRKVRHDYIARIDRKTRMILVDHFRFAFRTYSPVGSLVEQLAHRLTRLEHLQYITCTTVCAALPDEVNCELRETQGFLFYSTDRRKFPSLQSIILRLVIWHDNMEPQAWPATDHSARTDKDIEDVQLLEVRHMQHVQVFRCPRAWVPFHKAIRPDTLCATWTRGVGWVPEPLPVKEEAVAPAVSANKHDDPSTDDNSGTDGSSGSDSQPPGSSALPPLMSSSGSDDGSNPDGDAEPESEGNNNSDSESDDDATQAQSLAELRAAMHAQSENDDATLAQELAELREAMHAHTLVASTFSAPGNDGSSSGPSTAGSFPLPPPTTHNTLPQSTRSASDNGNSPAPAPFMPALPAALPFQLALVDGTQLGQPGITYSQLVALHGGLWSSSPDVNSSLASSEADDEQIDASDLFDTLVFHNDIAFSSSSVTPPRPQLRRLPRHRHPRATPSTLHSELVELGDWLRGCWDSVRRAFRGV